MSGETNKMTNENGNIYRKVFGDKLALLRMKNHLKQQDIADKLGIPVSTYRNYEIGLREAPYSIIVKLADILGVSLDYLFGRSTESNTLEKAVTAEPYLSDEEKAVICSFLDLPAHTRLALLSLVQEVSEAYTANLNRIKRRSQKEESTRPYIKDLDVPMDEASRKRLREYIKSKEGKEQLRRMLSTLSEVPGIDAEEADKNEDA